MNSQFNKNTVEEMNEDDDDEDEEETKDKEEDDGDDEGFSVLSELPVEKSERRPTCRRCCRPLKVCLCPYLPACPLDVSTCLYIVQHPAEESRVLRTVPLLAACLPPGKCRVFIGRRFSEERYPELAAVCKDAHTLLLYPGDGAEDLEDLSTDLTTTAHSVILIDGTWSQAKDMFLRNALLQLPRQVQLRSAPSSHYVIRTQPTNMCVSTLECAAAALSIMEKNHSIQEVLLKPLQALCSFQLQHGAQIHHSKEHLIKNGQYNKTMPKNKRKIRRMQKLLTNQDI
ncbi:DTW domain-containing protein 2 [Carassius auratus]|uniref:tRNA-uridine aminocarboxypropyltransferase n=1 Tax=Carassius auratus TaxID=7957 RepID=A0A6P6NNG0_CARAU|nr:DTW domain-containing protein 2-like [Carassius auratus]XP_052393648.1 tRNA-uridine aminocarboxypropyltransferase 2 [Carassius gibelio]